MTTRLAIGDTVLYFFLRAKTLTESAAIVGRPAIVTSIVGDAVRRHVNLHVFFERGDIEIATVKATSSMGVFPERIRLETVADPFRLDVPEMDARALDGTAPLEGQTWLPRADFLPVGGAI